jgi:uncharacterized protein (TIGR02302 family)
MIQPSGAKSAELPSRLAVLARRARYAILWERVWPPLAALASAAGLFFALSWLGLWLWLPPLGRAVGLILFGALALWAAFPFLLLRLPGFGDALHRLDRVSGLRHRPATTLADRLAVNAQDPYALALWNAHVARSLQNVNALRAGAPAPRVAGRDPYAVRGLVLIAVIATFIAAGGERWHRVAAAFDWRGVAVPANFRVDAWVAPPAYTGRPPIILPGIHPGDTSAAAVQSDGPISVPVNSTLVVRATGKLKTELSTSGGLLPAQEEGRPPAGAEEHRFTVTATGAATLRGAGETLVWPLNAIPDRPPTIALIKDPEQQSRGALLLSYRLEDDYGVAEAQATFARKDDPSGHAARPLFGPPDFALVLPQARTKNGTGQTIKDLTDHPWAGAEVTVTLAARDDAGNEGKSEPLAFRLPERVFTKPLARALIEQRRNLALDANARPRVTTALDALAIAPERFTKEAGIYLGLRSVYWSLERAKSDDDLRDVVKRLWQMAVGIEDGDIANAEEALRNAENALQQALDRGASDQELKALMEQLRAAMDRFLQAMAEQLKNSRELARPLSPNTRVLSSRDLQNMLDRLENLARSGAKDAARQLLQQLQEMMENLQMGMPDMDEGDEDMMSALDELGDMIHQQQQLRDRTFQQGQDQRDRQRGAAREGKPGQQQPNGNAFSELRQNQQALRDRLKKLLEDLKSRGFGQNDQNQQGQGTPGQGQNQGQDQLDQLGRAGEAMGDAAGDLGQSDAEGAVESQGRALDALRKGAQGLAQSMQQQMGRGPGLGRPGRFGQSRAQQDTDPLGRPLRGHEYSDDATVKIPDIDVQRARRIIEELRKRFGDFARPQEELDYIERLLKSY